MDLSIVIVSYNEADYLPRAIDSCLNQEYCGKYEIIIGDDGSSDGSIEIIKSYSQKYNRVIKWFVMDRPQQTDDVIPSIRVSNVIRHAFQMASGRCFMILSGDDYYCSNRKFELQMSFLLNNPRYVACYSDLINVNEDGALVEKKRYPFWLNLNRPFFWAKTWVHISCFCFRRSVLNNLLDHFCDDTGLNYSILVTGKQKNINDIMFSYRQRSDSIIHKGDQLDFSCLEILLFQDVLKSGRFILSSMIKYSSTLKYLFDHRHALHSKKYRKYLILSKEYSYNLLGYIFSYDNLQQRDKDKIDKLIRRSNALCCIYNYIYIFLYHFFSGKNVTNLVKGIRTLRGYRKNND